VELREYISVFPTPTGKGRRHKIINDLKLSLAKQCGVCESLVRRWFTCGRSYIKPADRHAEKIKAFVDAEILPLLDKTDIQNLNK
jgi:hypothetical protein